MSHPGPSLTFSTPTAARTVVSYGKRNNFLDSLRWNLQGELYNFGFVGSWGLCRCAAVRNRTRTRTNKNPNDTEASTAGRSIRACVLCKPKS